jgi:hypothetical protein
MNNVASHDNYNLKLLYATTGGLPYNPATYTRITEFTASFPSVSNQPFSAEPHHAKPAYEPEAPYPQIYTRDYKKTLLATL